MCEKSKDGRSRMATINNGISIASPGGRSVVVVVTVTEATVTKGGIRNNVLLAGIVPEESIAIDAIRRSILRHGPLFTGTTYHQHIIDPKTRFQCFQSQRHIVSFVTHNFHSATPRTNANTGDQVGFRIGNLVPGLVVGLTITVAISLGALVYQTRFAIVRLITTRVVDQLVAIVRIVIERATKVECSRVRPPPTRTMSSITVDQEG
mmetsp:Transcript_22863/g.34659  ORF Transcript_22863/g.34659 Transcript_22863/m.34659 type:complete len:207 (-) Transcript_22863:2089-2709(-)